MFGGVNRRDMAVQLAEIDARSRSNSHRLDDVERKLEDNERMLTSIAVIAKRQDDMDGDIKEIKSDVKVLAAKPAKRWEAVAEKVIMMVVAAVVTWVLTKVGFSV